MRDFAIKSMRVLYCKRQRTNIGLISHTTLSFRNYLICVFQNLKKKGWIRRHFQDLLTFFHLLQNFLFTQSPCFFYYLLQHFIFVGGGTWCVCEWERGGGMGIKVFWSRHVHLCVCRSFLPYDTWNLYMIHIFMQKLHPTNMYKASVLIQFYSYLKYDKCNINQTCSYEKVYL